MPFQNRSAYGEIFQIPTNYIDGIANKVWQEQKIREQQKAQQDKALDDEFAKNVAGVKSADIGEISKAYNDFKQAHINLQKKGQKATPQDQMDVMIKKANAFQAIAGSKEDKDYLLNRAKEGKNNKRYNPGYQEKINQYLNTPTSKRARENDDNELLYQYAMPNIDKAIVNAVGKGQEKEILVGVDDKDGLKDKYEVYKTINPPNVFYNNLFNDLAASPDNQGFSRYMLDKAYTDDEKEKLKIAYAARIADPNFIKLYGETKPFPESAGNTELGQATALKTMEAVVNLPIEKIKDKSVLNADRQMARKREEGMADKKEMAGIQDAYIRRRMKLNQSYKMAYKDYTAGVDAAQDEKVLNTFLKNTIDNGVTGNATMGGVKYEGTITDLPKDISSKYKTSVPDPSDSKYVVDKEPDRWMFTKDGKFVIPLYYKGDANKGGKADLIPNPNQKPIAIQNIKVDLAKLLLGQKQRGGEVIDQFDIEEVPAPTTQKGKSTPAKTKTVTVTSSKQTIPNF